MGGIETSIRWIAAVLGFAWVVANAAFGVFLGVTGALFNAPGIIFQSGYLDLFLLVIVAWPGYALWKWSGKLNFGEPGTDSER